MNVMVYSIKKKIISNKSSKQIVQLKLVGSVSCEMSFDVCQLTDTEIIIGN